MSTIDRDPEDQTVVNQLEEDQRQILATIRRTIFGGETIGLGDLATDIRLHDAISLVLKYYGGTPAELPNFIRRKA